MANIISRQTIGVGGEAHNESNGSEDGGFVGNIDGFNEKYIWGWVTSRTSLLPLTVTIEQDGEPCSEHVAGAMRQDVADAMGLPLNCGFVIDIGDYLISGKRSNFSVKVGSWSIPGSPVSIIKSPDETALDVGVFLNFIEDAIERESRPEALIFSSAQITKILQRTIDRANALRDFNIIQYNEFSAAIEAAGGLRGSIGHFFGVLQQSYPILMIEEFSRPKISIIIPVHNNFHITYNCIRSIVDAETSVTYEIIVVDDCSTDETLMSHLVFQGGVRTIRTPTNKGFVGACNAGWIKARGQYILFLNNDTLVEGGWLDALSSTLDRAPQIGVVGSRLLFSDGVLQECGGLIWQDGSGWNWGRNQDKDHPAYSFMRDTDYVSGAALMIRKELLDKLEGFDPYYSPAYYEDTDICFRARDAGYRVVVQPASTIIHLEGQSNGTDVSKGLKRYQLANRHKFRRRWNHILSRHRPNGREPEKEIDRDVALRALFIDETTPMPDQDAGSNAAFEHMLSLQRLGYRVVFLPADNMANIPRYTNALQAAGIECWYAPHAWSVEEYLRKVQHKFDIVYIHRKINMLRYGPMVKKYLPNAKVLFNFADIHALRELREAEISGPIVGVINRLLNDIERELDIALVADSAIVHSSYEKSFILDRRPDAKVFRVPWSVPITSSALDFNSRRGLAFIGGYGHPPNVDAVEWFLADIWPLIRLKNLDAELSIIGSRIPAHFVSSLELGINAVGFVADLTAALSKLRLTVAPLRYGAGVKGKVLTSLAAGVPCVMSTIAAEGLDLPPQLECLIADDPIEFSDIVEVFLNNSTLWEEVSRASRLYIQQLYSTDAVDVALRAAIES